MTKICARNQGQALRVGHCDFLADPITDLVLEPGAIIFTCIAACTLPNLTERFLSGLMALRPRLVVHFEPFYEHCDGSSLLDLLRRRYVEINDYNQNLLTLVREAEAADRLTIVGEIRDLFGTNPLFPVSMVAWSPTT